MLNPNSKAKVLKDCTPSLTTMSRIKFIRNSAMGFASSELEYAFAVGNHIEITHTSVQEFPANKIIGMETRLERATLGKNRTYWDRFFKNFPIVDASG